MKTANVTKTLMLAAVSALTIGAGSAMAQSYGPSYLGYWSSSPKATVQVPPAKAQVPSGSSDLPRNTHEVPFNNNYGTLANPG